MADNVSKHLREELPPNIVKGANLRSTINDLLDIFAEGREKNADLVNNFLEQTYFKGEESIIDKLIGVKPSITFDEIGEEGINLASAVYNNKILRELKECFDQTNDRIKENFINETFNKLRLAVGTNPPYNDFAVECAIKPEDTVISYLDKIQSYLAQQEGKANGRKAVDILKEITISNNDLNGGLIAPGTLLTTLPTNIKNAFDHLLSFEIGKEADRTLNIVNNITEKLGGLVSNSFPAINTIVAEHPEYKYEESKLGPDFESRKQAIESDKNLSEFEKKEKIQNLKRELYIKYLKTKNAKIGKALEELYNNNFDYSKIDKDILKDYMDKVIDFRIRDLVFAGALSVLKLNYIDMDDFSAFYKELARVDPASPIDTIIHLTNVNPTKTRAHNYIDIPIHKSIVKGEHPRLKDIDQFGGSAKAFDTVPFRYEIKQSDIDNLDINLEDRTTLLNYLSKFKTENDKYVIEGSDVGRLIYLFFAINSKPRITELDPEKQKKVEDTFGKVDSSEKKETPNDVEKFKNDIEKMGTGVKFEDGAEIWMPMGNSELPGGGYQWMKVKISDINMQKGTFTGTVFGGELKFGNNLEGKARTFDMNDKTIEKLKKMSKDSTKIRLLPNPNKTDFNSFKNNLHNKLGTSDLKFPLGTTWDGNRFTHKITDSQGQEKVEEVKYFSTRGDNESVYKVEYNPIRSLFKVTSTFNGKEKGKDGKSKDKRFSYSRDMDWNNFLIFFTQKGLTPQTEEVANDIVNKSEEKLIMMNGGHRKINRFSITNIKNVFKTIKGNIKKKMDDYNKAQDQKLEDILIGDWGLYGKLAGALGFIPSVKEGLGQLEQEYYNERDNRTWKKIEYYLKIFQADPDFGTTFDQVPPHAKIQGGKSLQTIVLNRVANAQDSIGDPGIYQAAALLLANFEKGGSPYRGLTAQENSGLWVKAIMGKAHYAQFIRDKAKLIKARDIAESGGPGDKKGLNETLAVCERKYIVNNIRGSYKGLIVGSYEERGIDGDKTTNYIDNPSKKLLSDQFANKLESAYKGRFNKGTVDEKYSKFKSNNSFDEIENEFGKAGSTRYQVSQAALRRMIDLSTNDELKKRMKRHFLAYLLSGALDIHCDPGLKKQVYGWAKPMMFVPGLLVKEAGVAENIAILLDDIEPKGDFSKSVSHYFHRNKQLDGHVEFKKLQGEINDWLTDEKMNQLDDYFSKLPTKDFSRYPEPQREILENYQKAMSDSNRDEVDRGILENPMVVSNGLLSSTEIAQKRMNVKKGEFDGKDIDEINNMRDFRKKVTADINNRTTEPRQVSFVLNKFFNWFGIDEQQVYGWICTADFWNTGRGQFILPYKGTELNMGNIGDKEINSILWYAFQGNAWKSRGLGCDRLPDELFDTLQAFQKYFSKAFYDKTLLKAFKPKTGEKTALLIGSRDVYDQAFAGDSEYQFMDDSTSEEDLFSTDDNKKRKAKKNEIKRLLKSDDFINSDIVNIEKQLKRNLGGTSRLFPTVTSSHSRTLREDYLRSRSAA